MNFGRVGAGDSVSCKAAEDGITGRIGPNGAGKTTLFNRIAGALWPGTGRVEFRGEDSSLLLPHRRVARGLVRTFQIPHEFHRLTVLENLMVSADRQDGEHLWENWLAWTKVRRREDEVRARAEDTLEIGRAHV